MSRIKETIKLRTKYNLKHTKITKPNERIKNRNKIIKKYKK